MITFRCLVFSVVFMPFISFGQELQISSVFPPQHDNAVAADTEIHIEFDAPIDTSGINQQFIILGTIRGLYTFNLTASPGLDEVLLSPNRSFLIGERVKVTVQNSLSGANGETFTGFNWQFNIQPTKVTSPHFSEPRIFSQFSGFTTDVAMYPADINCDGHIDLVMSGIYSVQIALNDGIGNFILHQQFPSYAFFFRAPDIPITDFDLDGRMELVTMQNLYELDDNGDFQLTQAMPLRNFRDVEDMNGDGYPDLISIDIVSLGPPEFKNNVTILYNDGSGHFALADTLLTDDLITDAVIGDFNNDGVNDIAYSTSIYASPGGPDGRNSLTVIFMKSDGDTLYRRIYNDSILPGGALNFPFQISTIEMNNDGFTDAFIGSTFGDYTLLNDKNNGFLIDSAFVFEFGDGHHWTTFADLTGNALVDVLCSSQFPFEFAGSCGFRYNMSVTGGLIDDRFDALPYVTVGGDFNGDGSQDAATIWSDGLRIYFNDIEVSIPETNEHFPRSFTLSQNYPNPFNSETNIRINLYQSEFLESVIVDITGKEVMRFPKTRYPAGKHRLQWDSRNNNGKAVSSGIYFWKFNTQRVEKTIKLILTR